MASPEQIPGELLNRIARFGRLYLLETVTSTNDYAFSLAGKKEPAIIVAQKQTKGRGRFRRRWFADENSLTFSLLLFPQINQSTLSFSPAAITQIAGLALCQTIETLPLNADTHSLPKPTLRWPNDVLLDAKKVAGILCEQRNQALVLGVGVNVNQTSIPENLPEATSLFLIYHQPIDRMVLLEKFLTNLFTLLEKLQHDRKTIWDEVRSRSAIIHHRVEIKTLLRRYVGTVIDIDDEGRVILRTDSGKLALFSAGQVRQLR
ncbi:biotin--[acetyl-CoA-carboxylase] ligase [candidate division WOR-3 bacterium]|jgi:BirA family biotin operon repressor/biotin-[acetyl-CoA-carboxylase] ligase|nr:biotin--[acetyl-CoA-carboxylase] ligase [candidate division WOR-3 bacterium]